MRLLLAVLLTSFASCCVLGQTYTISTFAGNGTAGFSGDNGPATSAQLSQPAAIAVDSAGSVFISDTSNNRIRKVSGGVITTVAGNGMAPQVTTCAQFAQPTGVAVDSAGNVYFAVPSYNLVCKVANGIITTVAGNGTFASSGDNGPALSAGLYGPFTVALDAPGNLYIAEICRIRKVSNGVITTVAGNGSCGFGGDNGPAINSQLNHPEGVAVDSAGNLYIADTFNNRIRKVSNGLITTVAGYSVVASTGTNGPASSDELVTPTGVAVDSAGNIYIAAIGFGRILKVSNNVITRIAGGGSALGDNGPATSALLYPQNLAVDSAGKVFIADQNSNRIRLLIPATGTPAPDFTNALRIAQIAEGASWKTLFAIVNLNPSSSVNYAVNFWNDNGAPLQLPIVNGSAGATLFGTIPPNTTYFFETPGTSSTLLQGWGEVASDGRIGVLSIFRQSVSGRPDSEGTVNGTVSNNSIFLPFDNSNGYVTGVAVANTNPTQTLNISLLFQLEGGGQATGNLSLPAHAHTAFVLPTMFPAVSGARGTIHFTAPTADLSVVGLRFSPTNSFTSLGSFQ